MYYEFMRPAEDEEPLEVYRGTEADEIIFENKLEAYIKENAPHPDEINRIMKNVLNLMRADIGNSKI